MAYIAAISGTDMIDRSRPDQVRGILQDQLNLLCGKGQYLEWAFANVQRRYGELPEEIRTSRFVNAFDRQTGIRELSAQSPCGIPIQIFSLKQASQDIGTALEKWNLIAADGLLEIAGLNLQRAMESMERLKAVLERHEDLFWEVLERRNQLLCLDAAVGGLTARYISLSERFDKINPRLGSDLVNDYARALCEAGFASGVELSAAKSQIHIQVEALDHILDVCRHAVDDCNVARLSEALGLGEQYVNEAAAYLSKLEWAVWEFEIANSTAEYDCRYFPDEGHALCASPIQMSEHSLSSDSYQSGDSYETGKELIHEVDNYDGTIRDNATKRFLVDDILDIPPRYETATNIPDFKNFDYLDDPEFDYVETPALNHPRPRSLSPRAAVKRWMKELSEDAEVDCSQGHRV